jgi:integrase
MIQAKTNQPVILHLHPVAMTLLRKRRQFLGNPDPGRKIFNLPSHTAAAAIIKQWSIDRGIKKKITPKTGRLTYSILLQDQNVDNATVAYLLGHTTTKQVNTTYKRHRPKDAMADVEKLPMPLELPYHLQLPDDPTQTSQ